MHSEKGRFLQWLRRGFLLRFHMTLLLVGAFVAGLITTKVLLEVNLNVLWLRYLIAVTVAYAVFVALIKLWLIYIGIHARQQEEFEAFDLPVDLVQVDGNILPRSLPSALEGAGGRFGGGGATGHWGDGMSASAPSEGVAGVAEGVSVDFDDAILVVLVVAALLAAFLSALYLIWAAPTILAEAAFEAVLASVLVRRAKKIDTEGWVGSVVRATIWPMTVTLLFSVAVGWYAQKRCPGATKLVNAVHCEKATLGR